MILVRLLLQTVVLALGQIWSNRFRALLTTLGIVIGTAAVIATVGATNGLKAYMLSELQSFGARKVFIDGDVPRKMRGRMSRAQVELKMEEIQQLIGQVTTMETFTPLFFGSYDLQAGQTVLRSVQTLGIWPEWHEIEARYTTMGRPFNRIDEEQHLNVCLVNDKTTELLGLPLDPTGEFILIGGRRFLIVGVVETRILGAVFGGQEAQAEVFIPLSVAMAMNPQRRFVNFLLGNLKSEDLAEEAKQEVSVIMRRIRKLGPDEEPTWQVGVVQQVIDQVNRVGSAITAGAGGIVAISLLVGGVGIMNIMLVSVSERTREIGLRKAVGARPSVILMQFLVEAVVLCLVGAAMGLAIGYGLVYGLSAIPGSPLEKASVPVWATTLAVGFSAFTGIVFGMFPATKAARLNPIEALRHE